MLTARGFFPRLGSRLVDGLFPRSCGLCGAAVAATMCRGCRQDLPWIGSACRSCATPLRDAGAEICADCQRRPPPFSVVYAPLHYAFPVDALVKALKFRRRFDLAPMLADLLLPWVRQQGDRFDALVPVPLHRYRHAVRGFNQADELARHLSKRAGLPVVRGAVRCRITASQTGLSAAERRKNLRNAFAIRKFDVRHPLLVDDVVTTGETCRALAKALLAAGAQQVGVVSVARSGADRRQLSIKV